MMMTIEPLKNYPQHIPELAHIWYEVLGKIWVPDVTVDEVITKLNQHLNHDVLPITFVALEGNIPIGMCSLRENDDVKPELTPWLGALVVHPSHQRKGIAKKLIDIVKRKAMELNYSELNLFTFDPTMPDYYERLGWNKTGIGQCRDRLVTIMKIDI